MKFIYTYKYPHKQSFNRMMGYVQYKYMHILVCLPVLPIRILG